MFSVGEGNSLSGRSEFLWSLRQTLKFTTLWVKASFQSLASVYLKSLKCSHGSSKPPSLVLPPSRLHPYESPPNDDTPPRDAQNHSHTVLKCPPENKHTGFQSSFLSPLCRATKPSRSVISIKPRLFLIWSDLDCCVGGEAYWDAEI